MAAAAAPQPHACGICGAPNAPFGFRRPGLLRDLPPGRRGTFWACRDHRATAEARQRRAASIGTTQDNGEANA